MLGDRDRIGTGLKRWLATCALLPLMFAWYAGCAFAAPANDLSAWERDFEAAFRQNDMGLVVQLIDKVKYPHLDTSVIAGVLNDVQRKLAGQKVVFASVIQDFSLGHLFRRVSVGVRYEKNILCYSVLFAGNDDGWNAANFDLDDDVNKCLTLTWPRAETPNSTLIQR